MATAADQIPRLISKMMRERDGVYACILHKAIVGARERFQLPLPGHPPPDFDEAEDLLQVIRGIGAVMEETIEGTGVAIRTAFFEDSAEALAKAGIPPFPYQAHVVAAWQAGVIADMAPRLAEEDRAAATDWMMWFFANYASDVIEISLRYTH